MGTRPSIARPSLLAALRVLGATSLLVLLATCPVAAVEAQGIRMDPSEPSALGAGSVLRPAVPPGGAATYDLVLHNQREETVEVLVYGADLTAEGAVTSGTDNRGVGAWIEAARPRVTLEPGGTATAAVTVTRPAGDTVGGTGAIVAQLSERSRQDLGLDVIRRAALRVEVAGDGSGDGLHVEVVRTDRSGGLLPGVLAVDVRFAAPGQPAAGSDVEADTGTPQAVDAVGTVVLSRLLVDDRTYAVPAGRVPIGGDLTATVKAQLPWYGVIGQVRAEAATAGLTTTSAPVRVVVLPPWLGLPLVVLVLLAAVAAIARLRTPGGGTPSWLEHVPLLNLRGGLTNADGADAGGTDGVERTGGANSTEGAGDGDRPARADGADGVDGVDGTDR